MNEPLRIVVRYATNPAPCYYYIEYGPDGTSTDKFYDWTEDRFVHPPPCAQAGESFALVVIDRVGRGTPDFTKHPTMEVRRIAKKSGVVVAFRPDFVLASDSTPCYRAGRNRWDGTRYMYEEGALVNGSGWVAAGGAKQTTPSKI